MAGIPRLVPRNLVDTVSCRPLSWPYRPEIQRMPQPADTTRVPASPAKGQSETRQGSELGASTCRSGFSSFLFRAEVPPDDRLQVVETREKASEGIRFF